MTVDASSEMTERDGRHLRFLWIIFLFGESGAWRYTLGEIVVLLELVGLSWTDSDKAAGRIQTRQLDLSADISYSLYERTDGGYLKRLLSSSGTVARAVSIAVGNSLRGARVPGQRYREKYREESRGMELAEKGQSGPNPTVRL
ncbi:hypothetical protein DY000_02020444 [Brassica cretica]|uniref:Uncharacterized protein n=1 Tax=Brassica cretica TaxID=69181 RepID=A0ABQ7EBD7_BRACR|nr:hypothetical protein DY000_02020444 [Brassica cretica]